MSRFFIIVIHPGILKTREESFHKTVKLLSMAMSQLGYQIQVSVIPQIKSVDALINEFKKRIERVPYGINDINNYQLSTEVSPNAVSNWISHEVVLQFIQDQEPKGDDVFLVLEDDAILVDQNVPNIANTFRQVIAKPEWNMLFLGAAVVNTEYADSHIAPIKDGAIMPCKESYMIRPSFMTKLQQQGEMIRSTRRLFFSYIARTHMKDVFFMKKALTIDGSKFGYFPSTLHVNSPPTFHPEFKNLVAICEKTAQSDITKEKLQEARTIYNMMRQLKNPYAMYVYGSFLYRSGDPSKMEEAIEIWEEAISIKASHMAPYSPTCKLTESILSHYKSESVKETKSLVNSVESKVKKMPVY